MSRPTRQRRAPKQETIARELRRQIVTGVYRPGSRIPTRVELEAQFNASTITVQRALDELATARFIEARGTLGTFVSERPPHLYNYGLVLPMATATTKSHSKFWAALTSLAHELNGKNDRTISVLYGGRGHLESEDFRRTLLAIRGHQVAGLIYASLPVHGGQYLFTDTGVPEVCVGFETRSPMAAVSLDHPGWLERALRYFVERGRRRVGLFYLPTDTDAHYRTFLAWSARMGLETRSYWNQPCGEEFNSARAHAELLARLPADDRPDALIIRDDNLEEPVLAGLLAGGAKVGTDILVLSHANFPTPYPKLAAVERLGFDVRRVLIEGMRLIDQARSGQEMEKRVLIPAIFESEFSDTSSSSFDGGTR
jgi:DNA-binding LacI/PurR family transcriptional regulator